MGGLLVCGSIGTLYGVHCMVYGVCYARLVLYPVDIHTGSLVQFMT